MAVINSFNVHFLCDGARVCYLRPLASSMDRSHFTHHLDRRIAQKLSNFRRSRAAHPQEKRTPAPSQAQMQVINTPPPPQMLYLSALTSARHIELKMEGQFSGAAPATPQSRNIDKTKAAESKLQMVPSRREGAGGAPGALTFKYGRRRRRRRPG